MNTDILAPVQQLTLPDAVTITSRAQAALEFIESFQVDSPETFELAGDELRAIKARSKKLEEQRTSITGPINAALRAVNALFAGPADVLADAEGKIKQKMLAYQTEQERLAAEARRRAEEAAAAERKRLEEEAAQRQREAQAQAEEAAAAQRAEAQARATAEAAQAAGDTQAAAAATAQADAAAQQASLAQAATHRAQAEAQTVATEAQLVVAAPVVAIAAPKAAGVSTSKKVDFEVTDLHALIKHVAEHPELLNLVTADSVKLRAYVRGLGTACALPGVRVFESKVLSARAVA